MLIIIIGCILFVWCRRKQQRLIAPEEIKSPKNKSVKKIRSPKSEPRFIPVPTRIAQILHLPRLPITRKPVPDSPTESLVSETVYDDKNFAASSIKFKGMAPLNEDQEDLSTDVS